MMTSPPHVLGRPMAASLLFEDICEGLSLVSCPQVPPSTEALKGVLGGEVCSRKYTQITTWLCGCLEGCVVTAPATPQEEPLFRVELSSVLKELGCGVPGLAGAESLTRPNIRTAVLHYLVHEVMCARVSHLRSTPVKQVCALAGPGMWYVRDFPWVNRNVKCT